MLDEGYGGTPIRQHLGIGGNCSVLGKSRRKGGRMKTNLRPRLAASALLFALLAPATLQGADDWIDVRSTEEVRALLSNRTFTNGWKIVSHFRADGRGLIVYASGLRVRRTWEVQGDGHVCATSEYGDTECWWVQRHRNRQDLVGFVSPEAGNHAQSVVDGVPNF